MKRKLTITIDEEVLPRAKRYARQNGVSLSQLIEDALRNLAPRDGPSFSTKWRGKFLPAERNSPRYKTLAERYL